MTTTQAANEIVRSIPAVMAELARLEKLNREGKLKTTADMHMLQNARRAAEALPIRSAS